MIADVYKKNQITMHSLYRNYRLQFYPRFVANLPLVAPVNHIFPMIKSAEAKNLNFALVKEEKRLEQSPIQYQSIHFWF